MTEYLGILVKALDFDLALTSYVVIVLFSLALSVYWKETNDHVRRFLQADLLIFAYVAVLVSGISYGFYVQQASPSADALPEWFRLTGITAGILGFDLHCANSVWPRWKWPRRLFAVLGINAVIVSILVVLDVWDWI